LGGLVRVISVWGAGERRLVRLCRVPGRRGFGDGWGRVRILSCVTGRGPGEGGRVARGVAGPATVGFGCDAVGPMGGFSSRCGRPRCRCGCSWRKIGGSAWCGPAGANVLALGWGVCGVAVRRALGAQYRWLRVASLMGSRAGAVATSKGCGAGVGRGLVGGRLVLDLVRRYGGRGSGGGTGRADRFT